MLFRAGDKYEIYQSDAEKAAAVLNLPLIRNGENGNAKIRFKSSELDEYLPELVRAGLRVAIADALEQKIEQKIENENDNQLSENISPKQFLEENQAQLIEFEELDFNLGERWMPAEIYGRFASDLFDTEVDVHYVEAMDDF